MPLRRLVTVAIAALGFVAAARAQDLTEPDSVMNWVAPPYWSAPPKPAGDKENLGVLDAEIADVVPSPPMPFVAVNPCRIADTRGLGFSGQAGPPALSVGVARVFQIAGTVTGVPTQCGIPANAQAVSFQFSVTGMNSAGNLIAWPDGPPPTTSVLNWNASSVAIGNGIVVPLNGTGGVSAQLNGLAGAITHLIIDVNGYYAPVGIVNTLNGLSGAVMIQPGAHTVISTSGQNVTISNSSPAAWSLTGNVGTNPATNFLGTIDNQPLEVRVNLQRVFRLEPTSGTPNVIGGFSGNFIPPAIPGNSFFTVGGTIGGGGAMDNPNEVSGPYGTVAGGLDNIASYGSSTPVSVSAATVGGGQGNGAHGRFATVAGGQNNTASSAHSFIGGGASNSTFSSLAADGTITATVAGGESNDARGSWAFIGGGANNETTDRYAVVAGGSGNRAGDAAGNSSDRPYATVGGGLNNIAAATAATVPGGDSNTASGAYSFAAGRRAKALHDGSFVWGDGTNADVTSTGVNQFLVRANGGATFLRGAAAPPATSSALVAQHGGSGEAGWLWTSNSTNPWPVLKVVKHPSGTNNFFECYTSDGVNTSRLCHITAAGAFVAGSDFAEALPARNGKAGLEPGDVLVMSGDSSGSVEKSSSRYDTRAVGVYSTRPGFIGADKNGETRIDPDDVPVAITGIVPTKVTAENGPIEPGDLLTTSSTPGHAMKAKPVSVGGVEIHPPGTILGKALQPFDGEAGVIRVLVQGR